MKNNKIEFVKLAGDLATFRVSDVATLSKELRRGIRLFELEPSISKRQRKYIYALISDLGDVTGYETSYEKAILKKDLKQSFCDDTETPLFSLSDVSKEVAGQFIEYLVETCLREGIAPTDKLVWQTVDVDRQVWWCLKYRYCTVCHSKQNLQINHEDTVGIGNDRRHIDHRGHRLECLCARHHAEFHNIGAVQFYNKYHFHGILLDTEQVVEIGLMSQKQCDQFDELYKQEALRNESNGDQST